MTTPIAQRLVGVAVFFLVTSPLACREDPAPPGGTGGTGGGGSGGSGGRAGSGGSGGSGTGGSAVDAATPDTSSADRRPSDGGAGDGSTGDRFGGDGGAAATMRPFYSHPMAYPAGTIRPSNCVAPSTDAGAVDAGGGGCPQATLDQAVASFYDKWKTAYLRNITTGACNGLTYVDAPADFGMQQAVSELQGMGMLISVVMAGHDPRAQQAYDGMFKYARKFRSASNAALMARDVPINCPGTIAMAESQTDGDLDVALSLLMANRQWGSAGPINYLQEARAMIGVIKLADMSPGGLPVLGDWVVTGQATVDGGPPPDPKYSIGLRSSDLMPGHFRSFSAITADNFWMQAIDASHSVIKSIQDNHTMVTGLVPDFIVNVTTTPAPAPADWSTVNQPNDGNYSYHAARVPLRLASDYITSSSDPSARTKALLTKLNDWISGAKTGGNPAQIRDGYQLDGDNLGDSGSFLFEAPLGAGAIVDVKYQAWLNAIWARVSAGNTAMPADSHADSVRLLSLIVMSGNWWAP